MDITNFSILTDEEVIDMYDKISAKLCCMIAISDDEMTFFDNLFAEINRRDIYGKTKSGRSATN